MELAAEFEETQVLIHSRDGAGRSQARRAVTRVATADCAERLGSAVHEVGAVAAVNVQVHEPRCEIRPIKIDHLCGFCAQPCRPEQCAH